MDNDVTRGVDLQATGREKGGLKITENAGTMCDRAELKNGSF